MGKLDMTNDEVLDMLMRADGLDNIQYLRLLLHCAKMKMDDIKANMDDINLHDVKTLKILYTEAKRVHDLVAENPSLGSRAPAVRVL